LHPDDEVAEETLRVGEEIVRRGDPAADDLQASGLHHLFELIRIFRTEGLQKADLARGVKVVAVLEEEGVSLAVDVVCRLAKRHPVRQGAEVIRLERIGAVDVRGERVFPVPVEVCELLEHDHLGCAGERAMRILRFHVFASLSQFLDCNAGLRQDCKNDAPVCVGN
jgi:hypothetical protein